MSLWYRLIQEQYRELGIKEYSIELEDNGFCDEDRGGFGAVYFLDIKYRTDSDVSEIYILSVDVEIFVSDQDGGELYSEGIDFEDILHLITEGQIKDQIFDYLTKKEGVS